MSGNLKNIPDGTVLSVINLQNDQILKKVTVLNGEFYFKFEVSEPGLYGIWTENPKYDKDRLLLWLENSDIILEGNFDYLMNSKVKGSKSHYIYIEYDSICKEFNNDYTRLRVLRSRTTNTKTLDSIANVSEVLLNRYRDAKSNFYANHINSEVTLYYLYKQTVSPDFLYYAINVLSKKDIEKLYTLLPENLSKSEKGLLIKEYISLPEIPKEGDKFVDIVQDTPEGEKTSISENLGKLTLLEFWASNCGPCRAEHPKLRILYSKYKEKGFNIIGISGDDNKSNWIKAINADSIPWLNISDLRGSNNRAFMTYGIQAIPRLILLDGNGTILSNTIGVNILEVELEKILK